MDAMADALVLRAQYLGQMRITSALAFPVVARVSLLHAVRQTRSTVRPNAALYQSVFSQPRPSGSDAKPPPSADIWSRALYHQAHRVIRISSSHQAPIAWRVAPPICVELALGRGGLIFHSSNQLRLRPIVRGLGGVIWFAVPKSNGLPKANVFLLSLATLSANAINCHCPRTSPIRMLVRW